MSQSLLSLTLIEFWFGLILSFFGNKNLHLYKNNLHGYEFEYNY